MVVTLDQYLADAEAGSHVWGARDCLLWVADWTKAQTGVDPAAHCRGRYRTALGATRLVRRLGGFRAIMERGAASCGLTALASPVAGAVGLVDVMTPKGPAEAAGLYTGRRWAVLAPAGLLRLDTPAKAVWGLPCLKR